MFPNHARSSRVERLVARRSRSRAAGPSRASSRCVGFDFSGCRARSSAWWCASGAENEESPAAIALFDRGSTFTLYGGSVFTRWIGAPSSRRSRSSTLAAVAAEQPVVAEDPQVARLRDRLVGRLGDGVQILLASCIARIATSASCATRFIASSSKPVSAARSSGSDGQDLAQLHDVPLAVDPVQGDVRAPGTARRLRSTSTTGTSVRPRRRAASTRWWPPISIRSRATHHDGLDEAELLDRPHERGHLVVGHLAGVRGVGKQVPNGEAAHFERGGTGLDVPRRRGRRLLDTGPFGGHTHILWSANDNKPPLYIRQARALSRRAPGTIPRPPETSFKTATGKAAEMSRPQSPDSCGSETSETSETSYPPVCRSPRSREGGHEGGQALGPIPRSPFLGPESCRAAWRGTRPPGPVRFQQRDEGWALPLPHAALRCGNLRVLACSGGVGWRHT